MVLLLVAAGILVGLAMAKHKRMQTAGQPEPSRPAGSVAGPESNAPPVVSETNAAPGSNSISLHPAPLHLQGIVSDPVRPWAIVDGKTVYVGSSVGDFHVKQILPGTLVLEDTNGSRRELILGR